MLPIFASGTGVFAEKRFRPGFFGRIQRAHLKPDGVSGSWWQVGESL